MKSTFKHRHPHVSKSHISLTGINRLDIKSDVVMVAALLDPVAPAPFSSFSIKCLKMVCYFKIHSRNNYTVLLPVSSNVQA